MGQNMDDRQRMVNYRVDRMCNTEMTEEAAVPMPAGFDMEEYVQHQFRMFAGEEVEVVLECRNEGSRDAAGIEGDILRQGKRRGQPDFLRMGISF